jgi:hypothetical protein
MMSHAKNEEVGCEALFCTVMTGPESALQASESALRASESAKEQAH